MNEIEENKTEKIEESKDYSIKREDKILVVLKAVGNTPILKEAKFKIGGNEKFSRLINFLRTQLEKTKKFDSKDSLYLYINSSFSPSPSEIIGDVYQCFKVQDMLIVNYSVTEAWG